MFKKSVTLKMLSLILLPILAIFLACAIIVTIIVTQNVEGTVKDNITSQTKLLANEITALNNEDQAMNLIHNNKYGENGNFLLLNKESKVVASSDGVYDEKAFGELMDEKAINSLTETPDTTSIHVFNSVPSICVLSTADNLGMKVLAVVPVTHLTNISGSVRVSLIIVFVIMMLLSFGVVLFATLFFVKPINKIKDSTLQIAEGNFFVNVDVRTKDEIGQLANAIKKTVQRLSDYVLYIDEITEVLTSISEGDLTFSLRNEYVGEFSSIKDALLQISDSFNKAMSGINDAAEQVSSGSSQVSGASQALSQGSTQQASSIEELSSTIRDVSNQVKLNAENAKTANNLSVETVNNVEKCSELMRNMLGSMEQINDTSSNIAKIIKVIDDISFQTNILALNAAVEAARAGAAGKGFAVVADEVRNLANKSAQAAKNTTELIESSISAVGKGVDIAKKTASALNKIVDDCNNSSNLIGEITVATNDQATAVMQITQGVDQISAVVETNSATAEQTAAASEELSTQAELLKQMTSRFKLKGAQSDYQPENEFVDSNEDDNDYSYSTIG